MPFLGFESDIPEASHHWGDVKSSEGRSNNVSVENTQPQLFERKSIEYPPPESLIEKIQRLHLLLTITESAMDVPVNLEARRRIAFFTNSLFMEMPSPPKIRNMLSFSVLTPYYNEDVLFTRRALEEENEDGISILFYLQKIYPDEWKHFKERNNCTEMNLWDTDKTADAARQWASYRSQTLTRTDVCTDGEIHVCIIEKRISQMEREIKEWKGETEGRWKEKTSQWKKEKEDLHAHIQALKVDSQALKEEVSTLKQELVDRTTNELEEGEP
ncbi:hypothetical protein L7F22_028032 [Adiantum nelumboides]|nr:hypothetical protein [Adiantum nelumboides]